MTTSDVLFTIYPGKNGSLGIITLNRPEALNSLNHAMVLAMHTNLKEWALDTSIKAVIIQAVPGRAFCAGGDLRLTYTRHRAGDDALAHFFYDEYELNKCIFHYPKPYIALLDGITMGGGVGISIHGSHRVATEKLLFAMPETGIGFFPDVGGTYFLPRLPGKLGYYLGLTGARLSCDDCVAITIAQHKVSAEAFPNLIDAIANKVFNHDSRTSVTNIINEFQQAPHASDLIKQQHEINLCFAEPTVEEILAKLQAATSSLCQQAATHLLKKSPTSLKVTLQSLQLGATLSFDACMQQEYRLAKQFTKGHDFIEGIRAVIIDKDNAPHWQPDALAAVTKQMIDEYFLN